MGISEFLRRVTETATMHLRFGEFLKGIAKDTYPEPPSPIHDDITAKVLPDVVKHLKPGATVDRKSVV